MSEQLTRVLGNLEEEETVELVKSDLEENKPVMEILDACRKGMEIVGEKFDTGEYYVADLMFAAHIFEQVMEILKPELKAQNQDESKVGKILLATVKDDIHDLGKNLVATMLGAFNFEVVDIGVDVAPEVIYEKIRDYNPDIVGLSCLINTALSSMEETVKGIKDMEESPLVIIGGVPIDDDIANKFGADAYGKDASEAAKKCKELLGI